MIVLRTETGPTTQMTDFTLVENPDKIAAEYILLADYYEATR